MDILLKQPAKIIAKGIAARTQAGPGDKILWLHGYTLDSSSWGELWSFLPGWHHVGIDLPGHGRSDPIAPGSNLQDLGRRLATLCREQEIRHMAALSFGTITAIQIASELPDYFTSIVLGAPSIAGGPQDMKMAGVYMKLIALYRQSGPSPELKTLWMQSRAWRGIEKRPGLQSALDTLVSRHSWAELAAFDRMQQFTFPPQKEADLSRIQAPVQLLVGEHEMEAYQRCAEILMQRLPKAKQHRLPETDHLCMIQSPEESARLIRAHLESHAS